MNLLERMCEAMWDAEETSEPGDWRRLVASGKARHEVDEFRRCMRAAVDVVREELREPTSEMLSVPTPVERITVLRKSKWWRAMLDKSAIGPLDA